MDKAKSAPTSLALELESATTKYYRIAELLADATTNARNQEEIKGRIVGDEPEEVLSLLERAMPATPAHVGTETSSGAKQIKPARWPSRSDYEIILEDYLGIDTAVSKRMGEIDIDQLNPSLRVSNALNKIKTDEGKVRSLLEMPVGDMRSIRGFGPTGFAELVQKLEELKLQILGEETSPST